MTPLNDIEARVLGCLVEKEYTTPEYYPLTLNALKNAASQKSNRHPVMALEETDVLRAIDGLIEKRLATKVIKADSRVPKYEHTIRDTLDLSHRQIAVLAELLLRGAQTTGELRGRADRMYRLQTIEEVEQVLSELMEMEEPLAVKLPRRIGQKERRFMHLMCGQPAIEEQEPEEPARALVRAGDDRMEALETRIAELEREVSSLKEEIATFRRQFE